MQRDQRLRRLVARHLRSFALLPAGTAVIEAQRTAAVALAIADAGLGAELPGMPHLAQPGAARPRSR